MEEELKTRFLTLAALTIVATAQAQAQDRGAYIGFDLGRARLQADHQAVDQGIVRSGFATSQTTLDERDTTWKLFVGHQFYRNFAIEGGYTDFGRFSLTTMTTAPAGQIGGSIRAHAWSLDAVGLAPLSERVSVFGKVGVQRWDTDTQLAAAGAGAASRASYGARGNDWKLGLGARYDFSHRVGVRVEWERFVNVGDNAASGGGNIDLIAVGLQYRF
jgi:OOP family OmpA-OmpF porin